jgi:hypothetical protein
MDAGGRSTTHDDGAKGQRPCKAAPGPDWPALPELGRAVTLVIAEGFRKLVLALALTFYPLPPGEEITIGRFWFCE